MNFDLNNIIRSNILKLKPYASARDEFTGEAQVFLDANENSMGSMAGKGLNRYPDPYQQLLKERISDLKDIAVPHIFVGNGSDEAIDLLIRATCTPGTDQIIICPPTYGMYEVSANINDVAIEKVPLTADFQLDTTAILAAVKATTKLIFICSPNNPTGNCMHEADIKILLNGFNGLVVVDEAYIDFAGTESWIRQLDTHPNLVVLQTLSKAWGMAALRVGLCVASAALVNILNKIKPPYNINELSQRQALETLNDGGRISEWVTVLNHEKRLLEVELPRFSFVLQVYPSQANFLLVRVQDAGKLYAWLAQQGIVVRNRHGQHGCDNCLRITVGSPQENRVLLTVLAEFDNAGM